MTNEEAIKDIKPYVGGIPLDMAIEVLANQKSIEELGECYIIPKNGTWTVNGIDVHEALGKQIPQKLKDGDCPVCGSFISTGDAGYEVPYCKDCGQRLLWEADDD